jgi:hypothetical protein
MRKRRGGGGEARRGRRNVVSFCMICNSYNYGLLVWRHRDATQIVFLSLVELKGCEIVRGAAALCQGKLRHALGREHVPRW